MCFAPFWRMRNTRRSARTSNMTLIVLKKEGVEIRGIECDTMLASYLLDPSRRGHSLDDLAELCLEHRIDPHHGTHRQRKKANPISEVDIDRASDYACEDAEVTFRVAEILCPRLEPAGLLDLYKNVELPLIPCWWTWNSPGVRVDTNI